MIKWIFAFAGFFLLKRSIMGGVLGFMLGSFVENYQRAMGKAKANAHSQGRKFSPEDVFQYYQQQSSSSDFPTMLMALSAAVMKADGKILKAELDYVKTFFNQQFGPQFSNSHLQTLKQFLDSKDIPLQRICQDIQTRMQPAVRTQLLHYLFGIAKADGDVSAPEIRVIEQISNLMGVSSIDFESVKNMFYRNVDSDYTILGIDSSASDDEVKKAYRKMAIKFHPDKVEQMGEQYQKGAKEKFQQVQSSYEAIKKRRGMK